MRTRYLEVKEIITVLDIDSTSEYLSNLKDGDIIDLNISTLDNYDAYDFILTLLKRGDKLLVLDNTYFGFEGSSYTIEEILEGAEEGYPNSYNLVAYK